MIELVENRVYRPFIGGKLLDEFNSKQNPTDGHYPERWICSTTGSSDGKGISVSVDGKKLTHYTGNELDILVKLIDSHSRLMIQVHPDNTFAKAHFNSPFGKLEAWYILGTRVIDGQEPFVFLGFKKHVTKQKWQEIFEKQDIKAMEDCLHKIPVKAGDVFLIPGKVPHAMGSGVFFAEVQQPTDLTLRTERTSPDGRIMADDDLHCKSSFEVLFNCFDYNGADLQETLHKYKIQKNDNIVLSHELFEMHEINVEDTHEIAPNDYAIVIILEGKNKGKEYFLTKPHVFIGKQKLLVCYGAKR